MLWIGAINSSGYGSFWYLGKVESASIVSYKLFVGDIPPGKHVLHRCDIRHCCEPRCLFLGTNAENVADKMLKGRQASMIGTKNPRARLTEDQVREIRVAPEKHWIVAALYGISWHTVQRIRTGHLWRHVK